MYRVIVIINDMKHNYGTYKERDRAVSVAMLAKKEEKVDAYVEEIGD